MSRNGEETSPIDATAATRRKVYSRIRHLAAEMFKPEDDADADFSYIPSLSNDLALMILARVPLSDHWNLGLVNSHYLGLLRSGELYKIRKEIGFQENLLFFLAKGEPHWWVMDPWTSRIEFLYPAIPCDANQCFNLGDKVSLCVGNQLLVWEREEFMGNHETVVWRYELAMNRWIKGPSMVNPRRHFASANCGDFAFVAGGVVNGSLSNASSNFAEKYDPGRKLWESLPGMIRCRKHCAGCYMDNNFYVIGGIDEHGGRLTCGEFFDLEKEEWVLVPNMIEGAPDNSPLPPLIAVANNQLYLLDQLANQVKVYSKERNSWKALVYAPIVVERSMRWGVAFESLGDDLLVIGAPQRSHTGHARVMMFTLKCCPEPSATDTWWNVGTICSYTTSFSFNCSLMVA